MSKPSQVLQIDPAHEIVFKGPFNKTVTSDLTLSNPTDREVCFKVKTTAPKQYCVKPNSGVVGPHAAVQVAIMLQPLDDPDGENSVTDTAQAAKHKFMVQTCYMPVDSSDPANRMPIDAVWRAVEPNELMDTKLKVLFEGGHATQHFTAQGSFSNDTTHAVKSAASAVSGAGAESTELRKALDDRKRLQDELASLERENQQLRERVARSEVAASRSAGGMGTHAAAAKLGGSDSQLSGTQAMALNMYQALAGVIVALVLGLVLGRLVF